VLHRAAVEELPGIGLLNDQLSRSFGESVFLGAPLQSAISTADGNINVIVIASVMVVLMSASQFITQLQIMAKNMSEETKASPMFKQQRILLYILPLVFAVSGIAFPLGVMFYWLVSNFWTMGQQFLVIRNMPTPGSEAARAREARLARKGKLVAPEATADPSTVIVEERKPAQRQQPVSKNRAKKQTGSKNR
jgi:YidC/Oxa1 family membrane protein insertase